MFLLPFVFSLKRRPHDVGHNPSSVRRRNFRGHPFQLVKEQACVADHSLALAKRIALDNSGAGYDEKHTQ